MDRGGPLPVKTVNVVVCGNTGVGKTSLVRRFVEDEWNARSQSTTGMEYSTWYGHPDAVAEPRFEMKLNVWDVGGQERFRDSVRGLFKTADVVLFAFDVTDAGSLESISSRWLNEAHWGPQDGGWGRDDGRPMLAWLVGTKSDLEDARKVDADTALRAAASHGFTYVETSASEGRSVAQALQTIVHYLHDAEIGVVADFDAADLSEETVVEGFARRCLCCWCPK